MTLKTLIFISIFTIVFVNCNSTNSGARLSEVLKNHTRSMLNSSQTTDQENLLKIETKKLLSECSVDNEDRYADNSYNKNNRGHYSKSRRGSSNNRNYDQFHNRRYGNENNQYNSERRGNYGNNNNQPQTYNENQEESDETRSKELNFEFANNQNPHNGTSSYNFGGRTECDHKSNFGDRNNQWRPYNTGSYGSGYEDRNYGYQTNREPSRHSFRSYEPLRSKRSENRYNNNNKDVQCVSQCVFGYLEVLDDGQVPSETLMMKWLQEHYSNDLKRIRVLREARKCFAKLSTTDTEDGCEFSLALSKCLNLELE